MDFPGAGLNSNMTLPSPDRIFDHSKPGEAFGSLDRGIIIDHTGTLLNDMPIRAGGDYKDARIVEAGEHHYLLYVPRPDAVLAFDGLAAARHGNVIAVVLHSGGDTHPVCLSLEFARHLSDRRQNDPQPVMPCVTSATAPELGSAPGLVRVPHLVTVRDATRGLVDAVIWEVMTVPQSRKWLGGSLPCQQFFERRIDALLRVRALTRSGQLPAGRDGERLRELVASHYLSIRLVYRHPALFSRLVTTIDAQSDQGDGGWLS
jgi:hypothetical protein